MSAAPGQATNVTNIVNTRQTSSKGRVSLTNKLVPLSGAAKKDSVKIGNGTHALKAVSHVLFSRVPGSVTGPTTALPMATGTAARARRPIHARALGKSTRD